MHSVLYSAFWRCLIVSRAAGPVAVAAQLTSQFILAATWPPVLVALAPEASVCVCLSACVCGHVCASTCVCNVVVVAVLLLLFAFWRAWKAWKSLSNKAHDVVARLRLLAEVTSSSRSSSQRRAGETPRGNRCCRRLCLSLFVSATWMFPVSKANDGKQMESSAKLLDRVAATNTHIPIFIYTQTHAYKDTHTQLHKHTHTIAKSEIKVLFLWSSFFYCCKSVPLYPLSCCFPFSFFPFYMFPHSSSPSPSHVTSVAFVLASLLVSRLLLDRPDADADADTDAGSGTWAHLETVCVLLRSSVCVFVCVCLGDTLEQGSSIWPKASGMAFNVSIKLLI